MRLSGILLGMALVALVSSGGAVALSGAKVAMAAPEAPRGLLVAGWTGDRVGLLWSPALDPGVSKYNVYASDSEGPFLYVVSVPAGQRAFALLTRLYSSHIYGFYVTAETQQGEESAPSNIVYAGYGGRPDEERRNNYPSVSTVCDWGFGVPCWPD